MEERLYNSDEIYQAYKGEFGEIEMLATRERLAWQASMVAGSDVLDIGCSQGILGILLAREGKRVLGVDISKEAIAFAERLKNKENKVVKANLTFKVGDFKDLDIREKFDTIILGEVLEHLYYPAEMLEKVSGNLKKNGRIIITVPFGINDYYDHRKTYYLYNLLEICKGKFSLKEVKFGVVREFSNWVGIVITACSSVEDSKYTYSVLSELENSFYQRERLLLSKIGRLSLKNNRLQTENKQFLNTLEILEKLKEEKEFLQSEKEALQSEKEELQQELKQYNNEIYSLNERIHGYENRKILKIINFVKKIFQFPTFLKKILLKIYENIRKKLRGESKLGKSSKSSKSKLAKLTKIAAKIKGSNGSSMFGQYDVNIAIITDEFMFNYYSGAVKKLYYVNHDNYKEFITKDTDILLFVSCWYGMQDNDWQGIGNGNKEVLNNLFEIFEYAKHMGATVLFQTIEDPSNYEIFLPIAKKVDYIFTTDADKIEDYKKDTQNENVYFLEYGINPKIHNPIGCNYANENHLDTLDQVFFAGSWTNRYKDRCRDAKMLFNGVVSSSKNLLIANRNYLRTEESLKYPEEFSKFIIPAFPHLVLQSVHKLFDWNINLNSIKYSSTMCAMRVYELQALGTLILSNYSKAVVSRFPNIFIVNDSEQVKDVVDSYSQREIYMMKVRGIRNVLSCATVYDRLNEVFEKTHIFPSFVKRDKIAVLYDGKSKKVRDMFETQTYTNKDLYREKDFTKAIRKKYNYVTFFSKDYDYGIYYLEDMMNCFKFVDVPYITKNAHYDRDGRLVGKSHDYVDSYNSKFCTIFNLSLVKYEKIQEGSLLGDGYSSDPFGLEKQSKKERKLKSSISVVIPVGNDGEKLLGRTLPSLVRFTKFDEITILLLKDYTSEQTSRNTIRELENSYHNVKSCDNITVLEEIKKTKFFTFLRPGDIASKDIYWEMLSDFSEKADMLFGYTQLYLDNPIRLQEEGRYSRSGYVEDPKEFVLEMQFQEPSSQAVLFKTTTFSNDFLVILNEIISRTEPYIYKALLDGKKAYYFDKPVLTQYLSRLECTKDYWNQEYKYHDNLKKILKKNNIVTKFYKKITPTLLKNKYWDNNLGSELSKTNLVDGIKDIISFYNYDMSEKYSEELGKMPDSNGHEYYEKYKYKVAVITDQLAYNYFEGVADFEYVSQRNYKNVLKGGVVDMLLFVTCWYGMDNRDLVGHICNNFISNGILKIFDYAKSQGIPVVFWSKEDPTNYNSFLKYAKEADYIFTTAEECIEKYKEDTLNPNVFLLTYGVNPNLHNPIGCRSKFLNKYDTLNKVLFAGTWYPDHKERVVDQTALFDGVLSSSYELLVLDRNFFNIVLDYPYPKKYSKFVFPSMDYKLLQKFHKIFNWALNLNIVKDSRTMCAARVYELQALGVSIISNQSVAIFENFPNIFISESAEEVSEILNKTSPTELYKRQVEGIRRVYSEHTVFDKFSEILYRVGFIKNVLSEAPVQVIVLCDKKTKKITEMFNNQRYENKRLLELTELKTLDYKPYIAFFSEDYLYGENYLTDMINAFKYTDVSYITKNSYICADGQKKEGVEHDYVQKMDDKYRTVFSTKKLEVDSILSIKEFVGEGYSIDSFELKLLK